MTQLRELLLQSAALHRGLCPRQVLGVRMGLLAGRRLGLEVPRGDKRFLVFVETDGCAADGVSVATGCTVGRRTLRVLDFGKVAATFLDTQTGRAVRIHPHLAARERAVALLPQAGSRWHAQREGYQLLADDELLVAEPVRVELDVEALISRAGVRVTCALCGEEVINQREVQRNGAILCRGCAGDAYYRPRPDPLPEPAPARSSPEGSVRSP